MLRVPDAIVGHEHGAHWQRCSVEWKSPSWPPPSARAAPRQARVQNTTREACPWPPRPNQSLILSLADAAGRPYFMLRVQCAAHYKCLDLHNLDCLFRRRASCRSMRCPESVAMEQALTSESGCGSWTSPSCFDRAVQFARLGISCLAA